MKYQQLPLLGKFIEDDTEHAYKNINDLWNSVLEPKKPLAEDTDEEEEKKESDKENIINQFDQLNIKDHQQQEEKKNDKEDKVMNRFKWYDKQREYWDEQPTTIDGVLGGYGKYHEMETAYSVKVITEFVD